MSATKTAPQTERKDKFVELPTRMILTGAGLSLFQKAGTPIKRVLNRDGIQREGLESAKFNAGTIQKMVMNSYIEEIFAPVPDLLSRRYHVISTNNLIVYAILYKKLSPSLAKTMFETNVVREFNRKNPKNSIVDLKQIPTQTAEALVKAKADHFKKLEAELQKGVSELIMSNPALTDEDRQSMVLSLPKFLAWIDTRIWYLYYVIYMAGYREQMFRVFTKMLAQYLDHTRIATHLSNLLMEFVQNAEKAHFERIIVKNGFAPRDQVDKFLRDRNNRNLVITTAAKSRTMLDLSWNMNPERMSVGQQYRIQISISNFGIIDDRVRDGLAKKMKTNVDGIKISDFYDGGGGDDTDKLGAGLGLLYNSYLEDICKNEGIQYRCNIYPEPAKEKTTVRIEISL
ncbi:MAG: hypothetical protein NXI24_23935 [bacterium]|nr:hypothetical protein [bacterium]